MYLNNCELAIFGVIYFVARNLDTQVQGLGILHFTCLGHKSHVYWKIFHVVHVFVNSMQFGTLSLG
jgi:hypothetical protein